MRYHLIRRVDIVADVDAFLRSQGHGTPILINKGLALPCVHL